MPLDRATLERHLARLNASRPPHQVVALETFDEEGRFTLGFPNRPMPEGQCIDQDFSAIQWALHEEEKLMTGIEGGRLEEARDVYLIDYAVIEWD